MPNVKKRLLFALLMLLLCGSVGWMIFTHPSVLESLHFLVFLLPALTASVILTGIHTYLGIHVIGRDVIFVDISLAQMAALGMTFAFLLGIEPDSGSAYFFGLGGTFLGALIFAFFKDERISQEAIVGICFAVSSALAILLTSKSPHGSEHLKFLLSGNILLVSWPHLFKTAAIYGAVGLFHFVFRKPFILLSTKPGSAAAAGYHPRFWDLLFYLSFGFVITSSVQIGGILLVFSYLIVPATIATLFFDRIKDRLFFGWMVGVLVSVLSILVSFVYDLPTGPTIVAGFGAVLALFWMLKKMWIRNEAK